MRLNEINEGDIIISDGGFTCMRGGEKVVHVDSIGGKFVPCDDGNHYLDGQLNQSGEVVGFSKPQT